MKSDEGAASTVTPTAASDLQVSTGIGPMKSGSVGSNIGCFAIVAEGCTAGIGPMKSGSTGIGPMKSASTGIGPMINQPALDQ